MDIGSSILNKIRLGKTNLSVSALGFGGIPIQRLSDEKAIRVVQRCLDLGVTFLDTAHGYSTSEERIGAAIAGRRRTNLINRPAGPTRRAEMAKRLT